MALFCENVTGFGDASLGEAVLKTYVDFNGLTSHDCKELGIEPGKCGVLQQELAGVAGGFDYSKDFEDSFCNAGFSSDFTTALLGNDGRKALNERVKWLSEKSITDTYGMRPEFVKKLEEVPSHSFNVIPLLERLIRDDDPEVSFAAIQVLATKSSADIDPVLTKLAKEGKELLAISIMNNLHCYSDHTINMQSLLVQFAKHPDPVVREGAIRIMGPSYYKEHKKALLNALNDSNADVRKTALSKLSFAVVIVTKVEVMSAKPALMKMLGDGNDQYVRYKALELLGRTDVLKIDDADTLYKLLVHESAPDVRQLAYVTAVHLLDIYIRENYPFLDDYQVADITRKTIFARCKSEDPNWELLQPIDIDEGYGPGAR